MLQDADSTLFLCIFCNLRLLHLLCLMSPCVLAMFFSICVKDFLACLAVLWSPRWALSCGSAVLLFRIA